MIFINNIFLSNVFAANVINTNKRGSYSITRNPSLVWTKEESMYRAGVRAIFHLTLKFFQDGKDCSFTCDNLLSFFPYSLVDNIYIADITIEKLTNFIIKKILNIPYNVKLESIGIYYPPSDISEYKLDVIDIVASPNNGSFKKLPVVVIKPRQF